MYRYRYRGIFSDDIPRFSTANCEVVADAV